MSDELLNHILSGLDPATAAALLDHERRLERLEAMRDKALYFAAFGMVVMVARELGLTIPGLL